MGSRQLGTCESTGGRASADVQQTVGIAARLWGGGQGNRPLQDHQCIMLQCTTGSGLAGARYKSSKLRECNV